METVEQDLSYAFPVTVAADETPSQLLNTIIVEAYRRDAAEISIESDPDDADAHVWLGLDGMMLDCMQVPADCRDALASYLKLMCRLDVAKSRVAQIGRIDFQRVGTERIELRVAIIPNGREFEDIRVRVLRTPFVQLA